MGNTLELAAMSVTSSPGTDHRRHTDGQLVVLSAGSRSGRPVEAHVLEEDDRAVVDDRSRSSSPLASAGVAGDDDLDAGNVGEHRVEGVGVLSTGA